MTRLTCIVLVALAACSSPEGGSPAPSAYVGAASPEPSGPTPELSITKSEAEPGATVTPLAARPVAAADFADDIGKTARVGISSWEDGWKPRAEAIAKGINVEVAMTELVPADAPDTQPGMRGTVRLRFDDGSDVGVALSWTKAAGGAWHPEGWPDVFRHGKRTYTYFASPGGTAYRVWLTADLSAGPHVRWIATAKFDPCTK